jgi:hypothetical protein
MRMTLLAATAALGLLGAAVPVFPRTANAADCECAGQPTLSACVACASRHNPGNWTPAGMARWCRQNMSALPGEQPYQGLPRPVRRIAFPRGLAGAGLIETWWNHRFHIS